MAKSGAAIVYGRGGSLGSFEPFVKTLRKKLALVYGKNIVVKNIERRNPFFDFLASPGVSFEFKELHVFSHAFGAGLALGYQDRGLVSARNAAYAKSVKAKRKITYAEVLNVEVGIVFTDNLTRAYGIGKQAAIRKRLTSDASLKIWGCNAGVDGWTYSDSAGTYYWEALNTKNVPKKSIAQAFANYLGRPVLGAKSGSNIQVKSSGKWMSSQAYKTKHGKWPSGALPHRLHPTRGTYRKYKPATKKKSP